MINRPYQDENSKSITDLWEKYPSVLYQLPTGGGKTVVINDIIEKNIDKKIIILVHRQEIIFQIRDRLKERGITIGVLIGNYEENIDSDIIVGSILTVARDTRLQGILDRNFEIMVIDEAHHACSDSYVKTITNFKKHNPKFRLLGVTATPYRKDGKKLSNLFDVLIKGPTYSELRKDGYLADYTCYAAKVDELKKVALSGGDYKISSLSKFMRNPKLIGKAVQMYKDKGDDKQMLVFCVDKKHSIQVKNTYIKAGFTKIAHIDSDTPDEERKQINADFRSGKLRIITSVQTLTEGVDLPETKVIQCLRPTLSVVLYLQMLGRGTRLKADGSGLIIFDVAGVSTEHGLLDSKFDWNLNNTDPVADKKLNKRVGKKEEGGFTADVGEIEDKYLKIIEITHDEYLTQSENGIDIAKNENKVKDELILDIIEGIVEYLNTKCKLEGILFNFDRANYYNWNSEYKNIKCQYKSKNLIDIKYRVGLFDISPKGYTQSGTSNNSSTLIEIGKVAEFLIKDTIKSKVLKQWGEANDLYNSKVSISGLQDKINRIKKDKCIHKINESLAKGEYVFEFDENCYGYNYFRDVGYFNKFVFLDKPKKIKSSNRIGFYKKGESIGGYRGYRQKDEMGSVKKDVVISILFNNWYKD